MLFIHLTDARRAELDALSRQAVGRVALRAQMVLLSDRGQSVPEIARIHCCGQEVVRLWLPRYAAHEVNPAERRWGLLKDRVAANRLAGSIEALIEEARRFFAELEPLPMAASFLDHAA